MEFEQYTCLVDQLTDMVEQLVDLRATLVCEIPDAVTTWWDGLTPDARLAAIAKTAVAPDYSSATIEKYPHSIIITRIMKCLPDTIPCVRGNPKLIKDARLFLHNIMAMKLSSTEEDGLKSHIDDVFHSISECELHISQTIRSCLENIFIAQLSK